jgi:hypothetical protein
MVADAEDVVCLSLCVCACEACVLMSHSRTRELLVYNCFQGLDLSARMHTTTFSRCSPWRRTCRAWENDHAGISMRL